MSTRFNGKRNSVILGATNEKAHGIFAGKTLNEIGFQYQLQDADLGIIYSTNPKTGDEIPNLKVVVEGETYSIPFSRKFKHDRINEIDWLLECEFRITHKAKVDDNGNPEMKDDGSPVLDESQDYLSFGNPSGIVIEREESLFAEQTDAEKAKASLAGN